MGKVEFFGILRGGMRSGGRGGLRGCSRRKKRLRRGAFMIANSSQILLDKTYIIRQYYTYKGVLWKQN
jgi:hypothetical protein